MAYVQRVNRPFWHRNREVVEEPAATNAAPAPAYGSSILSQVVWFIGGLLLILLAFRFVLSLLGANSTNSFANFIYTTSHPFVAPFFNLFNYNTYRIGTAHFEIYTLVAMAVYAAIAWGLSYLFNMGRRY